MSEPKSELGQRALQRWENEGGASPKDAQAEARTHRPPDAKTPRGTRPDMQDQAHPRD